MPRGIPNTPTAAVNPVILNKAVIDSLDHEIGQDSPRTMSSTGPAKDALSDSVVQIVERPYDDEKMAMLAFMNEPVTVRIATTTDKNAEQVFELNINGQLQFFRRGETKTVPRFFVDRLARLKETGYSQREVINAEGVKDIVYDPHTGLKYDFAVTRDDHPRGGEWIRAILAEA